MQWESNKWKIKPLTKSKGDCMIIINSKNILFFKKFLFLPAMKLLKNLTILTAAEATVISFFIVSLIGGVLLYFTEKNRNVNVKIPFLQTVKIVPEVKFKDSSIDAIEETQVYTFLKASSYKGEKFIDTFFTSVSALCVTGLISTDFSKFTLPGQIIILILIQMGGLGIILFTSIFAFAIVRGLSEKSSFKKMLAGILDTERHDVARMIKHMMLYTFLFEGL